MITRTRQLLLVLMCAAMSGYAQNDNLKLIFEKLRARAVDAVDVTLDGPMLQLGKKFLSGDEPEQAKAKKLVSKLKGVYIRSFEFAKEGQYSQADVDAIRKELYKPGWSRIVAVRSKKDRENTDILTRTEGNQVVGLVIIAAEPTELTVVTIDGPMDLSELGDLGGQFGIPKIEIGPSDKPRPVPKAQ